jgi:hypothetical protein
MTSQQKQAFLQARAVSRISALTSIVTPDNVSAITTPTNLHVPMQIAHTQQSTQGNGGSQQPTESNSSITGPFAGRASHPYMKPGFRYKPQ